MTDAGEAYVAACRRILEDVAEAERGASGEYSAPKGELTVTAPIVFGRVHVLPVTAEFLKAYPDVDVRLVLADRLLNLQDEHLDVALRIGELPDSSLTAMRVGVTRRVVCASPAYLAKRGTPKSLQDIPQHDCVAFAGLLGPATWSFRTDGAEQPLPIHPRLIVNTAEAAIDAAIAGVGLTRVFSYQVDAAVKARTLTIVLKKFEPAPVPISLLYGGQRLLPQKLRAFLDYTAPRPSGAACISADLTIAIPADIGDKGRRRRRWIRTWRKSPFSDSARWALPWQAASLRRVMTSRSTTAPQSRAEPLVRIGARRAATPQEASHGVHAVIAMTADDVASRAVWFGPDGALAADLKPETFAIECSTLSHDWVLELAHEARTRKLRYIDAPVTGLPAAAADGALTLLVGASAEDLAIRAAATRRVLTAHHSFRAGGFRHDLQIDDQHDRRRADRIGGGRHGAGAKALASISARLPTPSRKARRRAHRWCAMCVAWPRITTIATWSSRPRSD